MDIRPNLLDGGEDAGGLDDILGAGAGPVDGSGVPAVIQHIYVCSILYLYISILHIYQIYVHIIKSIFVRLSVNNWRKEIIRK